MTRITLDQLGSLLRERRGTRGVRDVAAEIGISAATVSRVEQGHLPDLANFSKLCRWLKLDPAEMFGMELERAQPSEPALPMATAHLRANRTLDPRLAQALGEMILRAQAMVADEPSEPIGER